LLPFQNATGWPMVSPAGFDDATLDAYISNVTDTSFHYGSSVTMGLPQNGGGADGSGRVYGTTRLHVADDTLQPVPADGNTEMPAYIIGYKVSSDIIALDANVKHSHRKYHD
jgi:choline dehydrogenase